MTKMNKKLEFLIMRHKKLKEQVLTATGDLLRELKKEKLFVKDQIDRTRHQTDSVL